MKYFFFNIFLNQKKNKNVDHHKKKMNLNFKLNCNDREWVVVNQLNFNVSHIQENIHMAVDRNGSSNHNHHYCINVKWIMRISYEFDCVCVCRMDIFFFFCFSIFLVKTKIRLSVNWHKVNWKLNILFHFEHSIRILSEKMMMKNFDTRLNRQIFLFFLGQINYVNNEKKNKLVDLM